jgi:heat shock protein HtpX
MHNLYTHQDSNVRKTWLYMTVMLVVFIGLGWVIARSYGDPVILYIVAGISVVGNLVSYWFSDSIALALSGAHPITREQNTRLYRIAENLCLTAGLPVPRLYVIPGAQINAFATGRDKHHAAVAVTVGALERLDDNELSGVVAHELSHVGNRDILLSTVVVVIAGMISVLADVFLRFSVWGGGRDDDRKQGNALVLVIAIVAAVLAPVAAMLIRLAISRKREFVADASGVLLTRYPEGLAHALEKIAADQAPLPRAHNATAHLFLANPLKGKAGHSWLARLFLTHPPINERIRILRGMI